MRRLARTLLLAATTPLATALLHPAAHGPALAARRTMMAAAPSPSSQRNEYLDAETAAAVDVALMGPEYGFSIEALMELAGLSVASAVETEFGPAKKKVLVLCGPGNNGGDGLVAARHLFHFGHAPTVVYPKPTTKPLYASLLLQCTTLGVPVADHADLPALLADADVVVDALFGFSFCGAPRAPFDRVLALLKGAAAPVVSVDIPSGWSVDDGDVAGDGLKPHVLVSLTAPKLGSRGFAGPHYLGGRFVPPALAAELGFELAATYAGAAQVARIVPPECEATPESAVANVLDAIHAASSRADAVGYFAHFAPDAVFLGTDTSERWEMEEFEPYATARFEAGDGWTYDVCERHVRVLGDVAWFDESLENAKLGECRGSGVLLRDSSSSRKKGTWLVAQYNLMMAVPNDVALEVAALASGAGRRDE